MKTMLALLTTSGLCGGLAACGGVSPGSDFRAPSDAAASRVTVSTISQTAPPGGYLKSDSDTDPDDYRPGPSKDDQQDVIATGHGANGADRRAITTVVKSYLEVATTGDSAKGCALLDPSLATAVTEEQDQLAPGTAKTCAASLSRVLQQQHQRFAAEDVTTMVVTGVHVDGASGFTTLGFRTMPEGELVVHRVGSKWKIDALFASTLP